MACRTTGVGSKALTLSRGEARFVEESGAGLKTRLLPAFNGAVAERPDLLLDTSTPSRCATSSEYTEQDPLGGDEFLDRTFSGGKIGQSSDVGVPVTCASTRVRCALGGLNGFTYCAMGGLGRDLLRLIGGLRVGFCGLVSIMYIGDGRSRPLTGASEGRFAADLLSRWELGLTTREEVPSAPG